MIDAWQDIFGAVCNRFDQVCHAYCLMSNHYHVVVETFEGNLSNGMRRLNGVYTQGFTRTLGRAGYVFQGRYKSILVEKDSYLLELARYVVLNPLRAGMIQNIRDWPWRSYRATAGESERPVWLATDGLSGPFGQEHHVAIRKYIDFVRAGVGLPGIWGNIKNQIYSGSEPFVDRRMKSVASKARLDEILEVQRRAVAKRCKTMLPAVSIPKKAWPRPIAPGNTQ